MITGVKRVPLTIENVLSRVSEYEIFRYYMGNREWKLNIVTYSPFPREYGVEKNPSFIIGNRRGTITFMDFADSSKSGDCFTFVKLIMNLSNLDEVLKTIDRDLQLGICQKTDYKFENRIKKVVEPQDVEKHYVKIQIVTRKFTNKELQYWADFHIDIEDLRREKIYAVDKVYLNRKLFYTGSEFAFGYLYEDGKWKVYRPFESKRYKWLPNNVPITTLDGKQNIVNAEYAFINKSKKDYIVMSKLLPYSCAVQNESIGCFSKENVEFFKGNSKKQILSFDSDVPGVTASQQITKLFDFDYCNVPREYLKEGIKDWAELGKRHGLKTIQNYLQQKQII